MQVKTSGRSLWLVALSCSQVLPPSVVLYAPPALTPMFILLGSFASIAIEWSPRPPKPGVHLARDG